jgi:hypothetical protein
MHKLTKIEKAWGQKLPEYKNQHAHELSRLPQTR